MSTFRLVCITLALIGGMCWDSDSAMAQSCPCVTADKSAIGAQSITLSIPLDTGGYQTIRFQRVPDSESLGTGGNVTCINGVCSVATTVSTPQPAFQTPVPVQYYAAPARPVFVGYTRNGRPVFQTDAGTTYTASGGGCANGNCGRR